MTQRSVCAFQARLCLLCISVIFTRAVLTDLLSPSNNTQMRLETFTGRMTDFYLKVRDFQRQLKLSQYIQSHSQSRRIGQETFPVP